MGKGETIENIYPLSPMQEGMLFHKLLDKDSNIYFEQMCFKIVGNLNVKLLKESINKIIERYSVLRTIFVYEDQKKPLQIVLREGEIDIHVEDISLLMSDEKEKYINIFKELDMKRGFNLSEELPLRCSLIKTAEKEYVFIFSFHHIILDGWSMPIIFNDLFITYDCLSNNIELGNKKVNQYSTYIKWLEKQDKNEALSYWKKYLDGYEQQAQVPQIIKSIQEKEYINKSIKFSIGENLTDQLKNIAQKNGVTVNTIFQTIWGILLQKYNNINDVVFGAVVSGRPSEIDGIEDMVGMFINTVPVRIRNIKDGSFMSLVRELQVYSIESKKYEYLSLSEIQANTSMKQKLIESIVVFENYPEIEYTKGMVDSSNLELKIELEEVSERINYKFNIIVEMNNTISVTLMYDSSVYDEQHVNMIAGHIKQVINEVVENSEIKLSEIDLLTEEEKKKILVDFNHTKTKYPNNKTIYQLFEEQVEKTPDNIAVVYEDKKLTYRELNERANSLARVLREKGVKADGIVGIMVYRSLEMIIGIMGILKSGGAYLPIDPEYPEERIEYMLEDSSTNILLTQSNIKDKARFKGEIVDLENKELYTINKENLENINSSSDLAYVIYTSGSTGKPKGVMIEHYSLVNRLDWMQSKYPIGEGDVILQKTPITFDVSVWELFWWSTKGSRVCLLAPGSHKNPEDIIEAIYKNNVTTIHFVPSMLNMFLKNIKNEKKIYKVITLEKIFTSGEALSVKQVKLFNKLFEDFNTRLYNLYGPTEATVDATFFDCLKQQNIKNIPIGKPISNTKIYIVDENNNLKPIGVVGELCISGDGLARGYLNRPELTEKKFIENPYEPGKKMYRTGDLARWLPDGNIEFIGRIDHQVKIRGFRIELGEIESQLLKNQEISEAVVMDREDNERNKYLCAYIVSDKEFTISELRASLSKELPDYMIPAYFMKIESIPVMPNGKMDRKALPYPDGEINTGVEYITPRNEIEEKLVNIWREVLGVVKIGIDDDFFSLGGDSIKAIQVTARLNSCKLKLTVSELFEKPTIRKLSTEVSLKDEEISQAIIEGNVELTAIQKWFFQQNFTNMHHWNQAAMLCSKNGFDERVIKQVFLKIVEHHDVLRIIVRRTENSMALYNKGIDERLFDLSVFDLRNSELYEMEIEKEAMKIQSSINLFTGPLIKLGLFKTNKEDHLLIVIHHLIVDGVSWRILFEDLALGYKQAMNGNKIELPPKTHSFKEWANSIQSYAISNELLNEIEYWKGMENTKVGNLLKDHEVITNKENSSRSIQMRLNKEGTSKLLRDVKKAYNTEINDILLATLGLAIKNWITEDKILVNIEGHGREEIMADKDITRTIGWFTSLYPIILDCERSNDISYYIKSVKESLRKIPNKGVGYSILKYITPKEYINDLKFKLKPQISFNYLGQFDNEVTHDEFNMSSISVGNTISTEAQRVNDININCMIANGEFSLSIEYNSEEYSQSTMEDIAEEYKKKLLEIIKHCSEKEDMEMTPSDFHDEELSIEELEYIESLIE